ncbi:MAG: PilZ domain-containing protein, partial [Candidatus Omnitrophica bacterium]|nr:PilZ domain-containing protein [Candidatus Omnitrophota bacterium]
MGNENRRIDRRIKFRDEIQYEKVFKDGSFSIAVCTKAKDITNEGICIYLEEPMELDSVIRIKMFRESSGGISYIGRVRWVQMGDNEMKYLVGVKIEDINEDSRKKLNKFLNRADLFKVIDELNLEKVVDLQLVAGYPPILKRIGSMEISKVEPFTEESLRSALLACLDTKQYEQFLINKEMNFVFDYNEKIRFRVNLHIQMGKVEGTFRLIPTESGIPSALGLPVIVDKLMENKKG